MAALRMHDQPAFEMPRTESPRSPPLPALGLVAAARCSVQELGGGAPSAMALDNISAIFNLVRSFDTVQV